MPVASPSSTLHIETEKHRCGFANDLLTTLLTPARFLHKYFEHFGTQWVGDFDS